MVYENDSLIEDLLLIKYIVVIHDENHVHSNIQQNEWDQHQNCTKIDRCHWMENENDAPWERHIHHQNQYHNHPLTKYDTVIEVSYTIVKRRG